MKTTANQRRPENASPVARRAATTPGSTAGGAFEDARPAAVLQGRWQALAAGSSRAAQLKTYQRLADRPVPARVVQREPDPALLGYLNSDDETKAGIMQTPTTMKEVVDLIKPSIDDETSAPELLEMALGFIPKLVAMGMMVLEDERLSKLIAPSARKHLLDTLMTLLKKQDNISELKGYLAHLKTFLDNLLDLSLDDARGIREIGDALMERGFEAYIALGGSADPVAQYLEIIGARVCYVAASGIGETDDTHPNLKFIVRQYLKRGGLLNASNAIQVGGDIAIIDAVSNGSALRVMKKIVCGFGFSEQKVHSVALNRLLEGKKPESFDQIEQLRELTEVGEKAMKKIGLQIYKEHPLLERKFAKFGSKEWATHYDKPPTENPLGKSKYEALARAGS